MTAHSAEGPPLSPSLNKFPHQPLSTLPRILNMAQLCLHKCTLLCVVSLGQFSFLSWDLDRTPSVTEINGVFGKSVGVVKDSYHWFANSAELATYFGLCVWSFR